MKTLIKLAMEAREKSYCPYSGFAVGAALQTKEGKIYQGCNIENAAFTPTNCAERTAFFKAVSEGEKEFCRIAIVGGKKDGVLELTSPCGVCLQVMQEFCDPDAFEVILAAAEEKYEILKLRQLLPYGFEL
ncbi:MAG: cytidine deaminase [Eubacterium sp.]|nr:cytidine deaminase [Eubacterium sp.]